MDVHDFNNRVIAFSHLSSRTLADDYGSATNTTGSVSVGSNVTGNIETSSDTDWFQVYLNRGTSYTITERGYPSGNGTLSDTYLRGIYNSSGVLQSGSSNDDANSTTYDSLVLFTPLSSGTYYISAGAYGSYTGTYRVAVSVADDYGSTTSTAGSVSVGGSVTGNIETSGDIDWFQVYLNSGTSYTITESGSPSSNGTLSDTYLRGIYDSSGNVLSGYANDDASSSTRDSLVVFTPSVSGTYYISAGAYSTNTGTYRVAITQTTSNPNDDYLSTTNTTGVVSVGGSSSGNIEVAGDTDWFQVSLTSGVNYIIMEQGLPSGNGTLSDTYLRGIYNSSGVLQSSSTNDDANNGTADSMVSFTPTKSGTYYISTGAYGNYTGTYRVSIRPADDYSSSTSTTGSISIGSSGVGNIETSGDTDWFRVSLTSGITYTITERGLPSGNGTLGDTYLRGIYNSSGTLLSGTSNDDMNSSTVESQVLFRPSSTGTYYISAGAYGSYTGTYTVSITGSSPDDYASTTSTTGTVSVGGSSTGNIEASGDTDWFKVNLTSGVSYIITEKGSPSSNGTLGDPYIRGIYNSSGTLLSNSSNDDASVSTLDSQILFTPTSSGAYYISAGAYGIYTGTYRVAASQVTTTVDDYSANTSTTGRVTVGGSTTGNIETSGDTDWFRVSLTAGVSYTITERAAPSGNGTLADSYLRGIYNSSGTLLSGTSNDDVASGNLDSQVLFTPSTTGNYYIAAGAWGNNTGSYQVAVAGLTNTAPTVTSPITNQVAPEGQSFSFTVPWDTFSDPQNNPLTYTATLSDGTSLSNTWLSFDGPSQTFTGIVPANTSDLTISVQATDPSGLFAVTTFTITTPSISDDYAATTSTTGSVSVGGSATGEIETEGDADWFRVTLSAGTTYTIRECGTSSSSGTLPDPYLLGIYSSDGTIQPNTSNNDFGSSRDSQVVFTPTTSGTYYIAASAYSTNIGSYTVNVTTGNRPPVVNGALVNLQALEGQSFSWVVPSGTFTDPDNQTLTYSAKCADGSALPTWMTFTPGTRTLSGTPPTGSPDIQLQITATDPGGLSASTTMTVQTPTATIGQNTWTILVYVDGDSNLDAAALKDINEMEAARPGTGVKIVIEVDRSGTYSTSWTDTRRGLITPDSNTNQISSSLTSVGELDMSNPQTLTNFINWGTTTYPAQHYALVAWDHGGGLDGTCQDFTSNYNIMSVAGMTQAISSSNVGRMDVIGFDTCLQGMVEQAADLAPYSNYVVASENFESFNGWNYTSWLNQVSGTSTALQVATAAVTSYDQTATMSATASNQITNLENKLTTFVNAVLSNAVAGDWTALRNACSAAWYPNDGSDIQADYRDLGGFLTRVAANATTASIRTAAQQANTALTTAVVAHTNVSQTSGLDIYLPSSTPRADYTQQNFSFLAAVHWNSLINAMNQHNTTALPHPSTARSKSLVDNTISLTHRALNTMMAGTSEASVSAAGWLHWSDHGKHESVSSYDSWKSSNTTFSYDGPLATFDV